MKALMLSVRPQWTDLIVDGKKIFEIRKSRPKIEPPFKCYIYETKAPYDTLFAKDKITKLNYGRGMVIGEFTCNAVFPISIEVNSPSALNPAIEFPGLCMTDADIYAYLGNGKTGWLINIHGLIIYDKPKTLGEFTLSCSHSYNCFRCKRFHKATRSCMNWLSRPPQSWCYVEELEG